MLLRLRNGTCSQVQASLVIEWHSYHTQSRQTKKRMAVVVVDVGKLEPIVQGKTFTKPLHHTDGIEVISVCHTLIS
jgi:hypothetical protein